MTLTLELPPEVETRLNRQAQAQGKALPDYVQSLLAQIAQAQSASGEPTLEELDTFFAVMTEDSDKLPSLSSDALTRESIYSDHD